MSEAILDRTNRDSLIKDLSTTQLAYLQADRPSCAQPRPSREELHTIVEGLREVLFPGYFGAGANLTPETLPGYVSERITALAGPLEEQIQRGFCFDCRDECRLPACKVEAREATHRFLERLPEVQKLLAGDVDAAYQGDPASLSHDEVILCYPGLQALVYQRLAHELYKLNVPLIPRIITEQAHSLTGIDIHPRATIGERFFIDHGTGVVIGATCIIGANVRLYQGVTLGAKSFPLDENGRPIKGIDRHPIIEDDVIIYSGATILGRVTIGRGSVIGGNVWITRNVPPGSRITQVQARREHFEAGAGI